MQILGLGGKVALHLRGAPCVAARLALVFAGLLALLLAAPAGAKATYDQCFAQAGAKFSLEPKLLKAIAVTESNLNPNAVSKPNANQTVDIGLMQINSSWLPKLQKHGIQREHLFDPCLSIHVGAWILAGNVASHGPTWRAVALYNSSLPHHQARYVQKVRRNLYLLNANSMGDG